MPPQFRRFTGLLPFAAASAARDPARDDVENVHPNARGLPPPGKAAAAATAPGRTRPKRDAGVEDTEDRGGARSGPGWATSFTDFEPAGADFTVPPPDAPDASFDGFDASVFDAFMANNAAPPGEPLPTRPQRMRKPTAKQRENDDVEKEAKAAQTRRRVE